MLVSGARTNSKRCRLQNPKANRKDPKERNKSVLKVSTHQIPLVTSTRNIVEKRLQEEAEAKRQADELIRLEEERKLQELELAKQREQEAKNRAAELLRLAIEEETYRERIESQQKRLETKLGFLKQAQDVRYSMIIYDNLTHPFL